MSWALLKTWKFWALLIVIGLIGSAGYFAVKSYNKVQQENVQLKGDLKTAKAEKQAVIDAQKGITTAVDHNDNTTREILKSTQVIERTIHALPITTDCVSTPAITESLRVLRAKREASSESSLSPESVRVSPQP